MNGNVMTNNETKEGAASEDLGELARVLENDIQVVMKGQEAIDLDNEVQVWDKLGYFLSSIDIL